MKLVDDIPHREHDYDYQGILLKYKLITLKQRRENICQKLLSKIKEESHPLNSLLPRNTNTHIMRLRNCQQFVPPRYKLPFIPSAVEQFQNCGFMVLRVFFIHSIIMSHGQLLLFLQNYTFYLLTYLLRFTFGTNFVFFVHK